MNNLLSYSIYFLIYGNIFLLFIKGYFPANETGILFISFLIFMTLAYKFAGSVITDELNARRKDILYKFEALLEQNFISSSEQQTVYLNIISQEASFIVRTSNFFSDLRQNLQYNLENGLMNRFKHASTIALQARVRELLELQNTIANSAYKLAIKQLLSNKITN